MSHPLDILRERDLAELRRQIRRMAELVQRSLADAASALRNRDRRQAYAVILADNRIDALEGRIDRMCQEFLVRHMPAAAPLRFTVASIKVNSELERMGDYADAIAHRVVTLHGHPIIPVSDGLHAMFEKANDVVDRAVAGFVNGDVVAAQEAIAMESGVDEINRVIFNELAHPTSGEKDLTARFAVLGILNRLERVADRAVNVAEDAIWVVRGEVWRHQPKSEQRVLFVSPADATLGPMAEAIARARAPLHVGFASCGVEPRPLDPRMVSFMARRGFDVVRPRARGIGDIGSLEDYRVVVTLSREAEERCPPLPYHTIQLFWDIPDPARAEESELEAVFERVFDELSLKVADLIDAMAGDVQEPSEVT